MDEAAAVREGIEIASVVVCARARAQGTACRLSTTEIVDILYAERPHLIQALHARFQRKRPREAHPSAREGAVADGASCAG